MLNPATAQEFLEARFFVEKATAGLGAMRSTPEGIGEMAEIIDRQLRAKEAGDTPPFSRLDAQFHLALAQGSKKWIRSRFLGRKYMEIMACVSN